MSDQPMNFTKLAYFVRIAETGSISRASNALGLAQPALSRFLRGFEDDLRCVLFDRNGRGVTLTDAGRRLYAHAKAILDHMEMAELEVAAPEGPPLGTVTLGVAPMLAQCLSPPVARHLQRDYPRVLLKVSEEFERNEVSPEMGFADVVVGFRDSLPWSVEATDVLRDRMFFAVRRDQWTGGEAFDWAVASELPLVMPPNPDPTRVRFEAEARRRGLPLRIAAEARSLASCVELVGDGLCATLVPGLALGAFPASTLALPVGLDEIDPVVVVATPLAKPLTSIARILRDIVIEECGRIGLQRDAISATNPAGLSRSPAQHPAVQ